MKLVKNHTNKKEESRTNEEREVALSAHAVALWNSLPQEVMAIKSCLKEKSGQVREN